MIQADIYKSLGDPVRLEMIRRLAAGSTYTIGNLSENLGVSRQGARKHVQVLVSAKVVHLKRKGRETQVVLNLAALELARNFIASLEAQWDSRLRKLKKFVETEGSE